MKVILYKQEGDKLKESIYTAPFVSGRHHRKVMEYDQTIDYSDIDLDQTDELVGFVCDVFSNQFTIDEFYDGIPSHKLISTITDTFIYVRTGKTQEELKEDEGNEQGKS
jgi:hypothetical protein